MLNRLLKRLRGLLTGKHRQAARAKAARAVIGRSKLFDTKWYVETYPDVATVNLDPIDHFIYHGAAEGRNPSSRFDLRWYVKQNPDVAGTGINPLLHYLQFGREEGRSIRAVDPINSADDFDFTRPKKSTPKVEQLKSAPYRSDFTSGWQAKSVAWNRTSSYKSSQPARHPDGEAWLKEVSRNTPLDSAHGARLHLFNLMRPEVLARKGNAVSNEKFSALHLLTTYGLGLETIADGWFAGNGRLFLRTDYLPSSVRRIQCFQFTSSDQIILCGEAQTDGNMFQLIRLGLDEELSPILLTGEAADGSLVISTLIPFPSLFRGGLHHSEVEAREVISLVPVSVAEFTTALTSSIYFESGAAGAFLVGQIVVDLQGANGSERLCNPNVIASIERQFGLQCTFHAPDGNEPLQLLAERLRSTHPCPISTDRVEGYKLILPADGLPSLSSLAARRGDTNLGISSFCVVDAGTGALRALACLPPGTWALPTLQHPALPLHHPILEMTDSCDVDPDQHWGAPIMIRYQDRKVWKVDALMPVSPDTPMPGLDASRSRSSPGQAAPIITILLNRPADEDLLLCLASIRHQTLAPNLEIILVGADDEMVGAPEFSPKTRLLGFPTSNLPPNESLNRAAAMATGDYLLFLDGKLCLPDPRTLELLLEIAFQPNFGSVSCALVREDSIDHSMSIEYAGYLARYEQDRTISDIYEAPKDVVEIFSATTYPVIANSLRLCLLPTAAWHKVGGLNTLDYPTEGYDIDLCLRLSAAGFDHYCTTLTSAAAIGPAQASSSDGKPAFSAHRLHAWSKSLARPVADIRRLRP